MANRTRTVLCGIDGSDNSVHAAGAAHALANALGAHLVLAHVSPHAGRASLPRPPADAVVAHDLEVISETAERAGLTGARTRRVEASSATEGLLAAARVESPDLIVVGASGRSAVAAALLGSVAGELPLRAPCPVVVTPPEVTPDAMRPRRAAATIVCAIAASSEAEAVAAAAGRLARWLGARLVLVHARLPMPPPGHAALSRHSIAVADAVIVEREQEVATGLLERAVEWSGCSSEQVETRVELGEPAERIEALAEREPAELIVVGSRGRGPLRAAVLGSTSRVLAGSARRPVVIVGPSARS